MRHVQVSVNGKLNSSKGLGSAALAARAADLMVYRRSLVDGAVGSSVTNTVLEDETKRLLEKMTVDQVSWWRHAHNGLHCKMYTLKF